MRLSDLTPLPFAILMGVAGIAAAVTPAAAAPSTPLTDTAYLALARCAGISHGLGSDATALDKRLDDEGAGREAFVTDKANQTRDETARAVKRAGVDAKAHFTAERDGTCKAYVGG